MSQLQTILKPSIENLVKEIHAVNHAWKLAIEMFNHDYPLAQSLRNLKVRLQVRLLRNYAPDFVYLKENTETISEESLYSLQLVSVVNGYKDAAHLPIRVAQEILSVSEINKFLLN